MINIYCDESCHLEHDDSNVMILGAISCDSERKKSIFTDIRDIKKRHNLSSYFEVKWTKVTEKKIDFFIELLEYFIENSNLNYRGLIAIGKHALNHEKYNNGDYNLWYYKMYYTMLAPIINPNNEYHIMIDIKDTKGGKRVKKLREVLCNNMYDFKQESIKEITQINSIESEILQLTDLINGAISYYHRGLHISPIHVQNKGKLEIINYLSNKFNLNESSHRNENKFNIFIWKPIEMRS